MLTEINFKGKEEVRMLVLDLVEILFPKLILEMIDWNVIVIYNRDKGEEYK